MISTKSLAACLGFMLLCATIPGCSNSTPAPGVADPVRQAGASQQEPAGPSAAPVEEHCTVFYAADDQVALGGNNEDNYYAGLTHIWFIPAEEGRHGMALVGYDNFLNPEGAINDQGLFFDGLAVRDVEVPPKEGAPAYEGSAIMKIMTECATVECALAFHEKYSMPGHANGQLLLGDRFGSSAIFEPLAIVHKEGSFQVATNFYQSEVPPAFRNDPRYMEATGMLRNADRFSVDLFRNTLDVVHQQYDGDSANPPLHTQYSTIYDLRKGLIYLYYFHDFQHAVTFDLKQELAKGIHAYEIPSLFPPSATARKIEAKYPANVAEVLPGLQRAAVDPDLLKQYAGTYQIEALQSYMDGEIHVKSEDGRLFIRNPWMPWVEGIPQPDGDFVYQYLDAQNGPHQLTFSFGKDASGQVTTMELAMDDGGKMPADRVSAGPAVEVVQEDSSQGQPLPASPGFTGMAGPLVLFALILGLGIFGILRERSLARHKALR